MKTATWNGAILAQSDNTVIIEGNHYFPPDSLNKEYFTESNSETMCPWKGTANYFTIEVDGSKNEDAAWVYNNPSELAKGIKGHVAFWKGVEVQ